MGNRKNRRQSMHGLESAPNRLRHCSQPGRWKIQVGQTRGRCSEALAWNRLCSCNLKGPVHRHQLVVNHLDSGNRDTEHIGLSADASCLGLAKDLFEMMIALTTKRLNLHWSRSPSVLKHRRDNSIRVASNLYSPFRQVVRQVNTQLESNLPNFPSQALDVAQEERGVLEYLMCVQARDGSDWIPGTVKNLLGPPLFLDVLDCLEFVVELDELGKTSFITWSTRIKCAHAKSGCLDCGRLADKSRDRLHAADVANCRENRVATERAS